MGVTVRGTALNAAAAAVGLLTLAPLAWMLSVSFMPAGTAQAVGAPLWPHAPTLVHYRRLFTEYGLGRPLLNSVLVASLATTAVLVLTVPAGYALAKLRFRGRERLLAVLLALLALPIQVSFLPLFLMMRAVHLLDSYAGLIAPLLASVFAILFVRQAALSIPDDMLDAARLDGAGEGRIFLLVAAPLLRPVLTTLALALFVAAWSDFLWPLIVLSDQRLYTLPVQLAALSREHGEEVELMMAASVMVTAPVLVIFALLQKQFVRGVLGGGVKG